MLVLLPSLSRAEDSIDDFSVVSHWTCDETSGVRYDSNTLNAYDLTDNNTVGYATGLLNNACDFEFDNSEYLSRATAVNIPDSNEARTISAWIKLESKNTGYGYDIALDYGAENTNQEFNLLYYNGATGSEADDKAFMDKYGSGLSGTVASLALGTWYHYVITYDGTDVKWYLNGSSAGSATAGTINTGSGDLNLGRRGAGTMATGYYDGLLDEISIFSSALTATQVTTLYNSGTPLPYSYTAPSSTPTSTTATSTSSIEDDNIVFMLAVIVFLLAFMWIGFIFNGFRKTK